VGVQFHNLNSEFDASEWLALQLGRFAVSEGTPKALEEEAV